MPHAIIVLADGFEEIEAVTAIDLLRRAGVNVTILGLDNLEVRGAHDIWIWADMLLAEFGEPFDAIVLPGGMPGAQNLADSENLLGLVRYADEHDKLCAAICAAPTVLAKAGILKNKKATCYPGFEDKMNGALLFEDDIVADYNVITSRGVGTAIPFGLALIEALVGEDAAKKVGRAVLHG